MVWKRLARLVAAPGRSRMRLWNPATDKFSDTAKRTDRLPSHPAAVYLYAHRRTQLLSLDFDAKRHGAAAVRTDVAAAASWITQCGGVVVTDRSSSGGAHLLCPLAIGTAASLEEMTQLVRLFAARLPTLDITPNTNAETGCLTPPGSPCREGGHRQLDGTLDAAVDAFTTRSAPDLLPQLYMLLGALAMTPDRPQRATRPHPVTEHYTVGAGDDERIAAPYVRDDPLPTTVADYATHGVITSARPTWQSNHEPRMSVVTQAVARGYSLADLRALIAPGGPWHHGLGRAYSRYHHRAGDALERDFAKAKSWLITNVLNSSPPRHKKKYSPGGQVGGPRGPKDLRQWLANALAWADEEFAGKRYRWTVHAVLQALAFHAAVGGEQRSGVWLVGTGGRSLSLGCGLLSEDTVWRTLADLRERPGAPLILARPHVGISADVYALTNQNRIASEALRVERVRIEAVHDAWIVLGHHLRRVYELVAYYGLSRKADIYAAAKVPRATGDAMVLDLETAGLLKRTGRGTVERGATELDDVVHRHRLTEHRSDRAQRYELERAAWRAWLKQREEVRGASTGSLEEATGVAVVGTGSADGAVESAYLLAVMATGPPSEDEVDFERVAIDLIADILGGRIVAA